MCDSSRFDGKEISCTFHYVKAANDSCCCCNKTFILKVGLAQSNLQFSNLCSLKAFALSDKIQSVKMCLCLSTALVPPSLSLSLAQQTASSCNVLKVNKSKQASLANEKEMKLSQQQQQQRQQQQMHLCCHCDWMKCDAV